MFKFLLLIKPKSRFPSIEKRRAKLKGSIEQLKTKIDGLMEELKVDLEVKTDKKNILIRQKEREK
jgi:hypothetical protein